jgi:hypothetical protein
VPGHGTESALAAERGRRAALDAWEYRHAAVHMAGLHVDGETGLYIVSSGCIVDELSMASNKASVSR